MFSPRLLAVFALLAAVAFAAAVPVPFKQVSYPQPITTVNDDDVDDFTSWFRGPWDSLFSSVWKLIPSFADIGPKIIAKDNMFKIAVNVKKYKPEDLSVKVKGDFIFVQGTHEAKHEDSDMFASQFYHTYSLPVNASAADVSAQLYNDGYLVVTAPLNGSSEKGTDREVPIKETGTPYNKDDKPDLEKPDKPAEPTSTAQPVEDDKKEQTTPSDREEVTDNNNVIPHGNEVQP